MNPVNKTSLFLLSGILSFASCSDSATDVIDNNKEKTDSTEIVETDAAYVGKAVGNFTADEWYPAGKLGTTENTSTNSYEDETPSVTENGYSSSFMNGETVFEHKYTWNTNPYKGLGPLFSRRSCIYCHPSYGHGKRQTKYDADVIGNGYLLALFYAAGTTDANGKYYEKDTYVSQITGVPQTRTMSPFLPEIDESGINIEWKHATDEHGNKFADGETYDLIYPEVSVAMNAIHTSPMPAAGFTVRVESTIGIGGACLIDAIPDDSIKKQYQSEAAHAELNPMMWDKSANDWASTAYMDLSNGRKGIKKFNYQLSRASLQQDYAIWEVCNVTRKDLHYLYTTKEWAKANSESEEVINYIMENGKDPSSLLSPYCGETKEETAQKVEQLLGLNSASDAPVYEKNFIEKFGEEMSDQQYYDFMVWQRGLAIPRARNLHSKTVQRGKEVFMQIGCSSCHRPSWTTGPDDYWATDYVNSLGKLPTYPNQKIYPYTDLVQHRLYMENDIINGWCRTTPLWGRGLSLRNTGSDDRLHDCRARTVIEAIMWHGYSSKSDAHWSVQNFYKLDKADRDAVVAFIEAI